MGGLSGNNRIAKNAVILYVRMFITMLISLYTSRIVLSSLGFSDYGLYNVVGGVVSILSFLNGTLSSGTQRFLSYAIGMNSDSKLKLYFANSLLLNILLAIFVVIVLETIGLWFLINKMNIPDGRFTAALIVYHISVISSVVSIIQIPYMSSIISHEKMDVFAYITIVDVIMKLAIVFIIQSVSLDKLITYSILIFLVNVLSTSIFIYYAKVNFIEARVIPKYSKSIFVDMISFSGWNTLGCLAVVGQSQGLNILFNIFLGTIVNAARAIAFQVNNLVVQFVSNFQMAVNPHIVKLFSQGKIVELRNLLVNNSYYATLLILIIIIPCYVELENILRIWLGDYPDNTIEFIRIVFIQSVIQTMTRPLVMAIHATGKMKSYSLMNSIFIILSLPISYLLLKYLVPVTIVLYVNVIPWLIELLIVILCLRKYIDFSVIYFFKKVILPLFFIIPIMFLVPYCCHNILEIRPIYKVFTVCSVSLMCSLIVILIFSPRELRTNLFNMLKKR